MASKLCDDLSGFTDEERVVIQFALAKLKEYTVVNGKKKRGRPKTKMPTCRQLLSSKNQCAACRKRRSAHACILRRVNLNQTEPDATASSKNLESRRKRRAREFYADFATDAQVNNLDERLENDISFVYPWCLPVHMGGARRSARLVLKQMLEVQLKTTSEKMKQRPLHSLIRQRKRFAKQEPAEPAQVEPTLPTQPVPQPITPPRPVDSMLSRASKRRLIQIAFELLGSPGEFDDQGLNQWQGATGVVNLIRDYIGFTSHRARTQILDVIRFVTRCHDDGITVFDAGIKVNANKSGRRSKLDDSASRVVARCLREGMGLQLTRAIVNKDCTNAADKVSLSAVRRSAKTAFEGECRNRGTKKTGSKDPSSVWCLARHEFALQLQQQFREGDTPGPAMIGTTVCKFFNKKMYVGKVTAFRNWYHVLYDDGDEEDLTFRELRVPEWHKIPRQSVLWVDEKVFIIYTVNNTHVTPCLMSVYTNIPHAA